LADVDAIILLAKRSVLTLFLGAAEKVIVSLHTSQSLFFLRLFFLLSSHSRLSKSSSMSCSMSKCCEIIIKIAGIAIISSKSNARYRKKKTSYHFSNALQHFLSLKKTQAGSNTLR
jgi:hypothetical protein